MYNRKQVFAGTCMALLLFGMTLITLGSILPAVTEKFRLDELGAGKLVAILPIGILLGSLAFGPLVDRYGYKILLIVSIIISVIGLQGLAFTGSLFVLRASIFIIGVGGGSINGATSALVSDISTGDKGASLSLLGVFFGIGALGMPLLLGVLSKYFAYPAILSGVGFFMLVIVAYIAAIKFPAPKQAQGFPLKEGIKLLKEPALLLTGFFLFFQSGTEGLFNNWTTSFLKSKMNTTAEDALYALSFLVVGLTVSRLLAGFLLKKMSSFIFLLISLLAVGTGSLVMHFTASYAVAFASLILTGAGLSAGFPVVLGYVGQLYPHLSGTAFSIAFVIALTGNTVLNYLVGVMAHYFSIDRLPVLAVICIVFMLVILFFIKQAIGKKIRL